MRDPKPLLRSHPTGPVANLLRAARADVPSAKGRRRTLAALGTAAGIAAATGTAEAAAAVSMGTAAMVKSVVGAAVVIAATGGAAYVGTRATVAVLSHPSSAAAQGPSSATVVAGRPVSSNPPPASMATLGAPRLPAASSDPGARLDPDAVAGGATIPAPGTAHVAPVVEKPRLAPTTPASRKTDDAASASGLAAELTAVDRARRALQSSRANEALAELDAYEARFSPPRFAQEATLLRVEALIAIGDTDRARAIGQRFLVREPDSTYSQRMRSLLGEHAASSSRP